MKDFAPYSLCHANHPSIQLLSNPVPRSTIKPPFGHPSISHPYMPIYMPLCMYMYPDPQEDLKIRSPRTIGKII